MFSLQRMLGREDKFFALLQQSAEEGRASVQALLVLLENPMHLRLDKFANSRRKEKLIANEISEALCTTFITAFEREDIEALSEALYRIPKTVEKTGEHIQLAPQFLKGFDLSRQVAMMREASDVLVNMNPDYDGVTGYAKLGWVACDKENESVSKTLEYAYDDYCVAQMAKALGKTYDYNYFMLRAYQSPSIGTA